MTGLRILGFRRIYKRGGDAYVDVARYTNATAYDESGNPRSVTEQAIEHLRPREVEEGRENPARDAYMHAIWAEVEPAYQAWLDGQELPGTGTPLAAWGGITAEQAEALKAGGLKTVEDVAAYQVGVVGRAPLPNMPQIAGAARAFLDSRPAAEMAATIAELKAELEALRAERMEGDEADSGGDDEPSDGEPAKRGPGRPRKVA